MAKGYRAWNPDQGFLLPPSPHDWLDEGHLVYFILDVIQELDLDAITAVMQAKDPRGERAYSPAMMTALLLYAYCSGLYSSRRIARACREDVAFRALCAGEQPHFTRISAFRRDHLQALRGLFVCVLRLCQKAGMVKLGHIAIDGTKMKGNASKHKAMSYGRMQETEQRLTAEIAALLARSNAADATDDERFGAEHSEEDIPAELRRRDQRLLRIREAKQALEDEARSQSETKSDADTSEGGRPFDVTPEGLPRHRVPTKNDGTPEDRAQRNFTDAESRIMVQGGSYLQGYNCQIAVDGHAQVIVAHAVTNQCPDNANLIPMLDLVKKNCGDAPTSATADSGYWTPGCNEASAARGVDVFVATGRTKQSAAHVEPAKSEIVTPRQMMAAKLSTQRGKDIYARRKAVVEPVFGQIKHARGFRQLSLRGLANIAAEWSLISTCHNLLKLYRFNIASALASA